MASEDNIPHAMKPKNGKLIFRAHEFDPKTDMVINYLTKETLNKQKSYQQYTIFVNNSYMNNSEVNDKNVFFAVNNIHLIRPPSYPYNDKTAQYYPGGEEDPKRAFFVISIDEKDKNCLGLKTLFENIDNYFQSEEFKLKYFEAFGYNEKTKDKFNIEYYPIYKQPVEGEEDEENKKAYSEYGSVKIKFDVQTKDYSDPTNPKDLKHPKIKTIIFKIDEQTKKPKKCNITTFKDIESIIRKNAIINFVIRFQKCYCSKPVIKNGIKKFTYGFSPIFEQITIHHSGDASSSSNHEYMDIGDGELDEGEYDVNKDKDAIIIKQEIPKKLSTNKKQIKNIKDEPDGEIDENEHISDDEDVQAPPSDESEEGDDEEQEEGGDDVGNEDQEEEQEEEQEEPEPPKKTTTRRTRRRTRRTTRRRRRSTKG